MPKETVTTRPEMMLTRRFPTSLQDGKWEYETRIEKVRVMTTAEGYAMVRFPRAMPFVCSVKDLSDA